MDLYLDHNAHSPLRSDVRALLAAHLERPPANPGSVHRHGQRARGLIERARRAVQGALGVSAGRVVFTGSATESNNLALLGAHRPGALVVSRLEHPSVVEAAERCGRTLCWWPNDGEGRLDVAWLEATLAREAVALVAVTAGNNELGTMHDLGTIAALCAAHEAGLHVDAAQVFGRLTFSAPVGATTVTMSAHKAGGPVGVGALWLLDDGLLRPRIVGGHQERGLRAGTEDAARIDAVGLLARTVEDVAPTWRALEPVRAAFEARLVEQLGAQVNGRGDARLPNTCNVSVPGIDAEEALMALDLAGIAASSGSACTAGSVDPSPVVLALGQGDERARTALRFSFGPEHASADGVAMADAVIDELRPTIRG